MDRPCGRPDREAQMANSRNPTGAGAPARLRRQRLRVASTRCQRPAMDKRHAPLISVVVPAHNEAQGIARAVQVISEVLNCCGVRWEVVVVAGRDAEARLVNSRRFVRPGRSSGIRLSATAAAQH
jgi:hypothetical protein